MYLIKFSFKNLLGAGLRSWLNTGVLAFTLIVIVSLEGLYSGLSHMIEKARISEEVGQIQLWHKNYDPLDPYSFDSSHDVIPFNSPNYTPILFYRAIAYPHGRLLPVLLKGISPDQKDLSFPTEALNVEMSEIPVLIGRRMAKSMEVQEGSTFVVRWKTPDGVLDAQLARVVRVFNSNTPAIDSSQIWVPLKKLQKMLGLKNHATILVSANKKSFEGNSAWKKKDLDQLLYDTRLMMKQKSDSGKIIYLLLIFLAMVSIFDAQILSIFRRKKEVGLLLALGFTQNSIILIFVLEGILQGFLAFLIAFSIGAPCLWYFSENGINIFSDAFEQFGLAGGGVLYPDFNIQSLVTTFLIVMCTIILVSYWPVRRISSLLPTQALRGNW